MDSIKEKRKTLLTVGFLSLWMINTKFSIIYIQVGYWIYIHVNIGGPISNLLKLMDENED